MQGGDSTANFTITFATSSTTSVIPDSCLESGGLCSLPVSSYPPNGRTWQLFMSGTPNQLAVAVEACSGTALVSVCLESMTKCSDPTNPVWLVMG